MKNLIIMFLLLFFGQTVAETEKSNTCSKDYRAFLERNARQGDARSASILGMIKETGLCEEPALSEAAVWYEIAARLGDMHAQFHLANIHYYSDDESGKSRAKAWYGKAAKQGLVGAMVMLANIYMLGEVGDKDLIKAYCWFSRASNGVIPYSKEIEKSLIHEMSDSEIRKAKDMVAGGSCEPVSGEG